MKYRKYKKLLENYRRGKASDAQRYFVDRWYDSFGDSPEAVPGLEDGTGTRERIWFKVEESMWTPRWYQRYRYVAAASFLVLAFAAAGWLFLFKQGDLWGDGETDADFLTVTTGSSEQKKIGLPDSSYVWLNARSVLEVPAGFNRSSRYLRLEGEAFFDVKSDTALPFIVDLGSLKVKVTGTSFNIGAYSQLSKVKVAVSSGRVAVSDSSGNFLGDLKKGHTLAYDKASGTFTREVTAVENNNLWITGKVVLSHADFPELANAMQNLYGTRLRSMNPEVTGFRYNLTLRSSQTEEDALGLICTMLNKSYKKEKDGSITIY